MSNTRNHKLICDMLKEHFNTPEELFDFINYLRRPAGSCIVAYTYPEVMNLIFQSNQNNDDALAEELSDIIKETDMKHRNNSIIVVSNRSGHYRAVTDPYNDISAALFLDSEYYKDVLPGLFEDYDQFLLLSETEKEDYYENLY